MEIKKLISDIKLVLHSKAVHMSKTEKFTLAGHQLVDILSANQ